MSVQESRQATGRKQARRPAFDRDVAERLATTEYQRVADLLERLTPEQWAADSGCPGWDVRAMAGHMLGMLQMVASRRELVRQQLASARAAKREGGLLIDALTALQVRKNAGLSTSELTAEVRRVAPRAVKGRVGLPAFLRTQTMQDEQDGWWTYAYLMDVVLTRDPFMHRIDITRATGEPMAATADHEGVLVDDVVREWAGRHGMPFTLELSGPAGGRWQEGEGGERLSMDAFDFCRVLSGRGPATGLLTTQVPF
ncbi:maleylpyruvate isomerase family mycothiol-dependent enzyme [Ornithinimicrobium cerasi]|uniref:maleylpyruvate isomerase family mycothiol-dependent enzyme n=1 Tax=Ornithinimicrobium cerasi TaxID=2248773 RepID=UPI000F005494|nr:maleylpyruvate isomerase family mycothiol-dependent enzyme [Ornithinimicrobium cerasi]